MMKTLFKKDKNNIILKFLKEIDKYEANSAIHILEELLEVYRNRKRQFEIKESIAKVSTDKELLHLMNKTSREVQDGE